MKTAIMTDTNSGLTKEEARRLGVYLLPMPVIVSGQVYYEGETIDEEAFYAAQRSGAAVSTSQPSPGDVLAMWERAFAEGYEQVVYLPMSSGLWPRRAGRVRSPSPAGRSRRSPYVRRTSWKKPAP